MVVKSKRTTISTSLKRDVILYKQMNPKATHESIATHFKLKLGVEMSRRAIGNIIQRGEVCFSDSSNSSGSIKQGAYPILENCLFTWFSCLRNQNMVVTEDFLKEKGLKLAEILKIEGFKCSNGWLHRSKRRFGISSKVLSGESESVDQFLVENGLNEIHSAINGYKHKDIFNVDETGLYYEMMPNKTLSAKSRNHGLKQSKKRVTVMLGVDVDGTEKLKPLVIGHSRNPRCFAGFNKNLYVDYKSSKKGWMNSSIWSIWLNDFNDKMKAEGRNALLLADNAPSHYSPELSNVKLYFLPPNTTSQIQPLDAGIINSFKAHYKKKFLRFKLNCIDEKLDHSIDLKKAVKCIFEAWREVSCETIKNCWRHTKIIQDLLPVCEKDNSKDELEDLVMKINKKTDEEIIHCMTVEEYLSIDKQAQEPLYNLNTDPQEIIDSVIEPDIDDNQDIIEVESKQRITPREAINGLKVAIKFAEESEKISMDKNIPSIYNLITQIESIERSEKADVTRQATLEKFYIKDNLN